MAHGIFIILQYTFYLLLSCAAHSNIVERLSKVKFPLKLTYIRDTPVIYPSLFDVNLYAMATAPWNTIYIAQSSLPNAGLGVLAARPIARFSYFGPYGGTKHNVSQFHGIKTYSWEIPDRSGKIISWVDAVEPNKSHWLRYINCPNTPSQENLLSFVRDGEIFYLATRNIAVDEELLVYYGHHYARQLGIDTTQFG